MIVRHYFSQGEVFKLQLFGGVDTQSVHRLFLFSTPFKETESHTDRREREGRERGRERKRGVE